ncbi:glycoside hydrolase family 3 protein [Ornithinimicrobium tianjinense]|uniref:beta-N-acetylhexosaminidase n=1 Tax=Ornithinimicrobium tianjinense TaxID=1195761 RepID=A0A917BGW6_9MICO|nr:glycoside hydrolase family 3 protein [Ornithinimicrobium tianjinense]GGF44809.1 beta-N-acetylhexosaminidase [Ornithinimicrobium tianjinense]
MGSSRALASPRVPARSLVLGMAFLAALSACTPAQPQHESEPPTSESSTEAPTVVPPTEPSTTEPSPTEPSPEGSATATPTQEPATAYRKRAEQITAGLSLEEKAGQVVVAAHRGAVAPTDLVVGEHLGGIILMDATLTTEEVRDLNATLTRAAEESGRDWPLFLGVDQEGGLVERAKGELTRFPTFMSYGAADSPELTRRASAASGAELRGIGFTVDFAPDADVTMGPTDPTIGSRSAGSDPQLVATQAVAAARGYLDAGVLPVLKHFPGHGSVPEDSHETLPLQERTLEQLREIDLVPFAGAVDAGLPAVMVGHIEVAALGSTLPSSVEPKVVDGLLREELGFDGLVTTDAVDMEAVAEQFGSGSAAVRALKAGVDVVLMPPDPVAARDAIERAVTDGRLPQARLDEAVTRQLEALLRTQDQATVDPTAPGDARAASREVSLGAITVVAGACQGALIQDGIVAVGDAAPVRRLTQAAEQAGVRVGRGTTVELLGLGQEPRGGADITVAMDTPYVLGRSDAPTRIALYGDTPGAMVALVRVLTGEVAAPGRLPVAVRGVERDGC